MYNRVVLSPNTNMKTPYAFFLSRPPLPLSPLLRYATLLHTLCVSLQSADIFCC